MQVNYALIVNDSTGDTLSGYPVQLVGYSGDSQEVLNTKATNSDGEVIFESGEEYEGYDRCFFRILPPNQPQNVDKEIVLGNTKDDRASWPTQYPGDQHDDFDPADFPGGVLVEPNSTGVAKIMAAARFRRVQIFSQQSTDPLAGAEISFDDGSGVSHVRETGPNGWLLFRDAAIAAGDFDVFLRAEGNDLGKVGTLFLSDVTAPDPADGNDVQERTFEVTTRFGGEVQVVDTDGNGIGGVELELVDEEHMEVGPLRSIVTEPSDGTASIEFTYQDLRDFYGRFVNRFSFRVWNREDLFHDSTADELHSSTPAWLADGVWELTNQTEFTSQPLQIEANAQYARVNVEDPQSETPSEEFYVQRFRHDQDPAAEDPVEVVKVDDTGTAEFRISESDPSTGSVNYYFWNFTADGRNPLDARPVDAPDAAPGAASADSSYWVPSDPGPATTFLNFQYDPNRSVTLTGSLADSNSGDGLSNIRVEVYSNSNDAEPTVTTTTNADGSFSVTLPERLYIKGRTSRNDSAVQFKMSDGTVLDVREADTSDPFSSPTTFTFSELSASVDVETDAEQYDGLLSQTWSIRGRLLDDSDSTPLGGYEVVATQVFPDSGDDPIERVVTQASAKGYFMLSWSQDWDSSASDLKDFEFTFRPPTGVGSVSTGPRELDFGNDEFTEAITPPSTLPGTYDQTFDVAKLNPFDAVSQLVTNGDHVTAAADYRRAAVQDRVYTTKAHGLAGSVASGWASDVTKPSTVSAGCVCESCESVLGKLAYLADLLEFAEKRVQIDGSSVDLQNIADTLNQPGLNPPVDCDSVQEEVPVTRISVEVLRRQLHSMTENPEAPSRVELRNSSSVHAYRKKVYDAILRELGTSLSELKRLPPQSTADETGLRERQTVADRLGIQTSDLSEFTLDASKSPTESDAITEEALEQLFGLRATEADESDEDGTSGDLVDAIPDPFADVQQPKIVKLRRSRLKSKWNAEDRPEIEGLDDNEDPPWTAYPPVVDPDIVEQGELVADSGVTGLVSVRATQLEGFRDDFEAAKSNSSATNDRDLFDDILAATDETARNKISSWSDDLQPIADAMDRGESVEVSDPSVDSDWGVTDVEHYGLTLEDFVFLRDIKEQTGETPITESQWDEVISILVEVEKRKEFKNWRQTEEDNDIRLSPEYFQLMSSTEYEESFDNMSDAFLRRYDFQRRLEWSEMLAARTDNWEEAQENAQRAVREAGRVTMPKLRDVLVEEYASSEGRQGSMASKRNWATGQLMVPMSSEGEERSRVEQAIGTVQTMLQQGRNETLETEVFEVEVDKAFDFDRVWDWLGAYRSWRSLRRMYTYPAEYLADSPSRFASGPYKELRQNVDTRRGISPEEACERGFDFDSEMKARGNVDVQASLVLDRSPLGSAERCQGEDLHNEIHVILFGIINGRIFYSIKNRDTDRQSRWKKLNKDKNNLKENEEVASIAGADVHKDYIGVFFTTDRTNSPLYVSRMHKNESGSSPCEITKLPVLEEFGGESKIDGKTQYHIVQSKDWSAPSFLMLNISGSVAAESETENPAALSKIQFFDAPIAEKEWSSKDRLSARLKNTVESFQVNPGNDSEGFWFQNILGVFQPGRWGRLSVLYKRGSALNCIEIFPSGHRLPHGSIDSVSINDLKNDVDSFEIKNGRIVRHFTVRDLSEKCDGEAWYDAANVISSGVVVYYNCKSSDKTTAFLLNEFLLWNDKSSFEDSDISAKCGQDSGKLYGVVPQSCPALGSDRINTHLVVSELDVVDSRNGVFVSDMSREWKDQSSSYLRIEETKIATPSTRTEEVRWGEERRMVVSKLSKKQNALRRDFFLDEFMFHRNHGTTATREGLRELAFLAPLTIARGLRQGGNYQAASDWLRTIFDYTKENGSKDLVSYLDKEGVSNPASEPLDWISDPQSPHGVARLRPAAYKRHVLAEISRTLVVWAEAKREKGTPGANQFARELLHTARQVLQHEMTDMSEPDGCDQEDLAEQLESEVDEIHVRNASAIYRITDMLEKVEDPADRESIRSAVMNSVTDSAHENATQQLIAGLETAKAELDALSETTRSLAQNIEDNSQTLLSDVRDEIGDSPSARWAESVAESEVVRSFEYGIADIVGRDVKDVQNNPGDISATWLESSNSLTPAPDEQKSTIYAGDDYKVPTSGRLEEIDGEYAEVLTSYVPIARFNFCTPPSPMFGALHSRIQANLDRMDEQVGNGSSLGEFTDGFQVTSPEAVAGEFTGRRARTEFRTDYLIETADRLIGIASNIETEYLSLLQAKGAAQYREFQARQKMEVVKKEVEVARLGVSTAENSLDVAELQRNKAARREQHFQQLRSNTKLQNLRSRTKSLQRKAAALHSDAAIIGAISSAAYAGFAKPGAAFGAAASAVSSAAAAASSRAQRIQTKSAQIRRNRRWSLKESLARTDRAIADERIQKRRIQRQIAEVEEEIASTRAENVEDRLEFLRNRVDSAELFRWMSTVVQESYEKILREAAELARSAYRQLQFERRAFLPNPFEEDYWQAKQPESENQQDWNGLTGASRLREDFEELRSLERSSGERRIEAEKTVALSDNSPEELVNLVQDGVAQISFDLEMFERDHPEHYERSIEQVTVNVVALAPPAENISARLSCSGTSRTIREKPGAGFSTMEILRDRQEVAVSSPQNENGHLLQLTPERRNVSEKFLRPFEGLGIDTTFEFEMPKASNPIDFDTIQDVYVTVQYTAKSSRAKRQKSLSELASKVDETITYSLRDDYPDEWYELTNNPVAGADIMLEIEEDDLPRNRIDIHMRQAALLIVTEKGVTLTSDMDVELAFRPAEEDSFQASEKNTIEAGVELASSEQPGSGNLWRELPVIQNGDSPKGTWKITFEDSTNNPLQNLVDDEKLLDLVLLLDVEAGLPDWPE